MIAANDFVAQVAQHMQQSLQRQQTLEHTPVLLREVMENLCIKPDGIYVDATFGRGGHSEAILQQLNENGRLLVIDKDAAAVAVAAKWQEQDMRVVVRQGSFTNLSAWLQELGWVGRVNGILLDAGVSSPQLDDAARGFSFMHDGPLDMRMDVTQKTTAADWINTAPVAELMRVFSLYGEERFSRKIAQAIVRERAERPIVTTGTLAAIVSRANPRWELKRHPATRVFQAIRIFINDELNELRQVLEQSLDALQVRGRLLVITFHSLEDQCVKSFMRKYMHGTIPDGVPIKYEQMCLRLKRVGSVLRASLDEKNNNARARSASLRVMEKIL